MECNGVDSFGCLMDKMGGWFSDFIDSFGNPAVILIFFIFLGAFIMLIAYALHNATQ